MERKLTENEIIDDALASFVKLQKLPPQLKERKGYKERFLLGKGYYDEGDKILTTQEDKKLAWQQASEKYLLAVKNGCHEALEGLYNSRRLRKFPFAAAKCIHLACLFEDDEIYRIYLTNSLRHYYYCRNFREFDTSITVLNNFNNPSHLKENMQFIYMYVTSLLKSQAQPNPNLASEHSENIHIIEALEQFIQSAKQYPKEFDMLLFNDVIEKVTPILQFILPSNLFQEIMSNYKKNHPSDEEVIDAISTFREVNSNLPQDINSILVATLKDKLSDGNKIEDEIASRCRNRELMLFKKKTLNQKTNAEIESVKVCNSL